MILRSHILTASCLYLLLAAGPAFAQGDSYARSSGVEMVPGYPSIQKVVPASAAQSMTFAMPELLGTYGPDGRFSKAPRKSRLRQSLAFVSQPVQAVDMPNWVKLHTTEAVVENYAPPAHAARPMKVRSQLGSATDRFFTMLYGHERVLYAPTHVATDSKGRVIVSDPDQRAIHVLDDVESFRIAGGGSYRLQQPNGLAVDNEDNIYVADEKLGIVQVYDPQGRYVRTIGDVEGENMFDRPTGIAIDREAGRLYVLDSSVGELNVLDLNGKRLRRLGGRRDKSGGAKFDLPTEIAAANGVVVILDSDNTRVQVLDANCNLLHQFKVRNLNGPPDGAQLGIALDHKGRVFVSNLNGSRINVYEQSGVLVGSMNQYGVWSESFNSPAGVWVDSSDRLFVADTNNSRVAVFAATLQASER